jgi:hypothetical protein
MFSGDHLVSDMFTPYIWKEHGIGTLFDSKFLHKDYGQDLKLLLIVYYVDGKFDINGPSEPKIGNYSVKKKDIKIAISVKFLQFHDRDELVRREFIFDSTINAIKAIQNKMSKKKLDIDFVELIADVISLENAYFDGI